MTAWSGAARAWYPARVIMNFGLRCFAAGRTRCA